MENAVSEEFIKNVNIASLLRKIHCGEIQHSFSIKQRLPLDDELTEIPHMHKLLEMREQLAHEYCDPATPESTKQTIIENVKLIHMQIIQAFALYY